MKLTPNSATPCSYASALEMIDAADSIIVLAHYRPDGDAIGSCLALSASLQAYGKQVTCVNQDAVPAYLEFLQTDTCAVESVTAPLEADLVIALDCATIERLGEELLAQLSAPRVLTIDHHITNERYGDALLLETESAATGEILYKFLTESGLPLPDQSRDALYVAISTDTGSLQYSNSTAQTYSTMASLVGMGADVAALNAATYFNHSVRRIEILRECLQRFTLAHEGQVAYWEVTDEAQQRIGVQSGDMEGLMDLLRGISGVRVCFTLEDSGKGITRLSMRSKDEAIDVSKVCAQFGGGGHRMAAGAGVQGVPFEKCAEQVLAVIGQAL